MKRYRYIPCLIAVLIGLISIAPICAQTSGAFKFAVIGDNRPANANLPQPRRFAKMIKEIDASNPAFAVNVGDCIYGSGDVDTMKTQYGKYADLLKSTLRAKMYLTIGNHEISGSQANQDFFKKELGRLYYSFDYGNSHFVVLDSDVVGEASRITGAQLEWLRKDLGDSKAANKFVFVHQPLYPVDGHIGSSQDRYPKQRDALHSLFMRMRVNTVFVGHEHLFNEQVRNGVRYIISGGGGAPTYPALNGEGDFYHYIIVTVDGRDIQMTLMKPAQAGNKAQQIKIGISKE